VLVAVDEELGFGVRGVVGTHINCNLEMLQLLYQQFQSWQKPCVNDIHWGTQYKQQKKRAEHP